MPELDMAGASVDARIRSVANIIEDIERNTQWGIRRWDDKRAWKESLRADKRGEVIQHYSEAEAIDLFGMPELTTFDGNLLLNEGIEEAWKLIATTGGTQFSNAAAYLGVGDSTTAEAATHTDLQASTNKLYKAMDATYPLINGTGNVTCNWKSTFVSAEANYAWQEYTVANASSGTGKNLNRKVSSQGTKQSGQTWELTLAITLS